MASTFLMSNANDKKFEKSFCVKMGTYLLTIMFVSDPFDVDEDPRCVDVFHCFRNLSLSFS